MNNVRKAKNCSRNYFIINLRENMGPGHDPTRHPWICSQTCYQLPYIAGKEKLTVIQPPVFFFVQKMLYGFLSAAYIYECISD